MKANYKNWVPKGMVIGFTAGTAAALAALILILELMPAGTARTLLGIVLGLAALGLLCAATWSVLAYRAFSYDGPRKLSKQIVEGTAAYLKLPGGGTGLDVGCGSGALTLACAKRNPSATMLGVDRWGMEYASFSQKLCEQNAAAEGVKNARFQPGNAIKLEFADESFDAVTSNYVYHNISGHDKQALLRETLRVLKKGGTFAIHDIMSPARYGDMQAFAEELRRAGYRRVELISTDDGRFMSPSEARWMGLKGSTLLVGRK